MTVTRNDIQEAAQRIECLVQRTPVMTSPALDRVAGAACFLKCENFQTGGSFKLRGAMNFTRQIPPSERARGVIAVSSGNHAQAVAIAAESLGMAATIVMPDDAPKMKLDATLDRGAHVILYNRFCEDRETVARAEQAKSGATFIHPFDHEWTIAGQGTAAVELLDQVNDLDTLLVCLGGGGLLSGCAIYAKGVNPALRVYGVEPELANDYYLSLEKGEPVRVDHSTTIADGLRTPVPGQVTFPLVRQWVDGVILVSEDEIRAALRFLLAKVKIVAEPSGAVTVAAVLARKLPPGARRVGLLVSGGNVDLENLRGDGPA
jgi:threonine dehydratase